MNICFISREYPPETHVGGIGTYTFNTATALTKLGHTVHVVTSTRDTERSYHDNGVTVHRIRNRDMRLKEFGYLYYSRLVAKKISSIDCRFDIVQASEFANEALWFSLRKKYPLVTRLATPKYLSDKLDDIAVYRQRPLLDMMEKRQTLQSDGIFSSTTVLAKTVAEKWGIDPSRVAVIPNSIDINRIVKLAENNPVPDSLKKKEFLLYFGRLQERKGTRVLAQALPEVLGRFPTLNMVFAGSDLGHQGTSMRDYIKQVSGKYQSQIIFFDNLPHERLFPIVKLAKMVVLPSLWEAFGFVCVEAMALGRPIIASAGSGFGEIIEDNQSGFLVRPGDSKLLAEQMISKLRDEDVLCRISEGAIKRSRDFEVSKIALRLLAYYEKVVQACAGKNGR